MNSLNFQDTIQDYQEMFIQFGYVVLFSSAFPLAAMCALINNIIEIRSDAFKLCSGLQRPFGMRVESIGQWQVRMIWTSPKNFNFMHDLLRSVERRWHDWIFCHTDTNGGHGSVSNHCELLLDWSVWAVTEALPLAEPRDGHHLNRDLRGTHVHYTFTCCTVPQDCCYLQYYIHTIWHSYLLNVFCTLQHFAVLLKYVIHVAIPNIPSWVSEEMAKLEFQRREAFKVDLIHNQTSATFSIFHFPCWYVMNICLVPARSTNAKHSSTSSNSRGEKEKRKNGSGRLSTRRGVSETMGGLTPLEVTTIMKRAKEANPDRAEGVEAL